jgi:hypothetical protein
MSDTVQQIDKIIKKIENEELPDLQDILFVNKKAVELFEKLPNVVKVNPPVTICGDIHGQFLDLGELFKIWGKFLILIICLWVIMLIEDRKVPKLLLIFLH